MFRYSYRLMRDLIGSQIKSSTQPDEWHVLNEALERLKQLDYLLKTLFNLEADLQKINKPINEYLRSYETECQKLGLESQTSTMPQENQLELSKLFRKTEVEENQFKTIIYLESFYYFSHRLIKLLKKSKIGKFDELNPRGIITVRNKLIEHPEGHDSRILERGFLFGVPGGPRIKPFDSQFMPNKFFDKGLWSNARELRLQLVKCIKNSKQF